MQRGEFRVEFKNNIYPSLPKLNKDNYAESILSFCKTPKTRAELIEFTGMSRYYTMSAIIQPLVDSGKLKLTIPDKPKSSKQQYVKA